MICISKDSSIYLVWIKSAQNWGEEIFLNQSFLTCIIGHPEQNYYNHHQHVSRFLYGEHKKIGFFLVCQLAVFECKQAVVILSPIHTTTNQNSLLQSTNNRDALHLSCLLVFIIGYWKFGPQWSPKKEHWTIRQQKSCRDTISHSISDKFMPSWIIDLKGRWGMVILLHKLKVAWNKPKPNKGYISLLSADEF